MDWFEPRDPWLHRTGHDPPIWLYNRRRSDLVQVNILANGQMANPLSVQIPSLVVRGQFLRKIIVMAIVALAMLGACTTHLETTSSITTAAAAAEEDTQPNGNAPVAAGEPDDTYREGMSALITGNGQSLLAIGVADSEIYENKTNDHYGILSLAEDTYPTESILENLTNFHLWGRSGNVGQDFVDSISSGDIFTIQNSPLSSPLSIYPPPVFITGPAIPFHHDTREFGIVLTLTYSSPNDSGNADLLADMISNLYGLDLQPLDIEEFVPGINGSSDFSGWGYLSIYSDQHAVGHVEQAYEAIADDFFGFVDTLSTYEGYASYVNREDLCSRSNLVDIGYIRSDDDGINGPWKNAASAYSLTSVRELNAGYSFEFNLLELVQEAYPRSNVDALQAAVANLEHDRSWVGFVLIGLNVSAIEGTDPRLLSMDWKDSYGFCMKAAFMMLSEGEIPDEGNVLVWFDIPGDPATVLDDPIPAWLLIGLSAFAIISGLLGIRVYFMVRRMYLNGKWRENLQAILLMNDSGIVLHSAKVDEAMNIDSLLVAGAFSALRAIVKEALGGEGELKSAVVADKELVFTHSKALIAVLVTSRSVPIYREMLIDFLETIHSEFENYAFTKWAGNDEEVRSFIEEEMTKRFVGALSKAAEAQTEATT